MHPAQPMRFPPRPARATRLGGVLCGLDGQEFRAVDSGMLIGPTIAFASDLDRDPSDLHATKRRRRNYEKHCL